MIKNIIFDFDGVILDSMSVKSRAFAEIFAGYNKELVDKLVLYHEVNGGLSRYDKIRFFFNNLLEEEVDDSVVNSYAKYFSELTKELLIDKKYLIMDTINFINNNNFNYFIASGADEMDLKYIVDKLNINMYFKGVFGSPKEKKDIVKEIIVNYNLNLTETILIGDTINDEYAASANEILFYPYNSVRFKNHINYINNMCDYEFN